MTLLPWLSAASPTLFFQSFQQNTKIFVRFSEKNPFFFILIPLPKGNARAPHNLTSHHDVQHHTCLGDLHTHNSPTNAESDLAHSCITGLPIVTFKRRFYIDSLVMEGTAPHSLRFIVNFRSIYFAFCSFIIFFFRNKGRSISFSSFHKLDFSASQSTLVFRRAPRVV